MMEEKQYNELRKMIARCEWTFAKTMPFAPHEYIVRDKCPLTAEEFEYFVTMQREYGVKERWGKYNNPYLYIDDYKYWTMGAPMEETLVINRAKVNILRDVTKMHEDMKLVREEVEENRPYHFNALLNSSPIEPNVSSIFAGFLKQRTDGQYSVLKSFVKFCFGDSFASSIDKPIIQTETEVKDFKRIDILVYEKGKYAIVIENKIWDATEQPKQLTNYIEGVKEPQFGFTDNQIYVVYMPSTDEHGPTNVSWSSSYQKSFEARYRKISFRDSVIRWLESDEIQSIDEEYFTHSRFLFIDFLKRVFNLTETDNMENQKIDEYIRKELGLNENDNSYNIAKITAKLNEITECANQLERVRKEYFGKMIKEWSARLEKDFPNCKKHEICGKEMCTGIVLPYKDIEDAIFINLAFIDKRVCYGATYMPSTHSIRGEMQASDTIRPFWESKEFIKGVDWLFYKYINYINVEEGYELLHQLIQRVI